MAGINKAILIGNMGSDIETKVIRDKMMGKFSLATSKKIKGEDRTVWHNIVVWDEKKVEYLDTYSKKGTKIYIEGEIENRKYEKDGVTMYMSEIVVGRFDSKVEILANGRSEDDGPARRESRRDEDLAAAVQEEFDDEVPF